VGGGLRGLEFDPDGFQLLLFDLLQLLLVSGGRDLEVASGGRDLVLELRDLRSPRRRAIHLRV